jgi:hypothetical protein
MMMPPPTPAHLTADNLTINLGMIEVGVTTATSVRITNTGQAALARTPSVTSSAPAELIISSNGCTTALGGGKFCDIALGFNPAAGEARSQTLSVSDGTTSVMVTVSATGARRLTVATTGGGAGTVTSIAVAASDAPQRLWAANAAFFAAFIALPRARRWRAIDGRSGCKQPEQWLRHPSGPQKRSCVSTDLRYRRDCGSAR